MAAATEARRAWVGLGANLEDPAGKVERALAKLGEWPGISLDARSSLYRSAPRGPPPQNHYCNAVAAIRTTLLPRQLLRALLMIEQAMGRARTSQRWSPRVIDLDLLFYEGVESKTPRLTLPHPEIPRRNFVLVPLAEIAPDLELPELGRVEHLAEAVGMDGLERWPGT